MWEQWWVEVGGPSGNVDHENCKGAPQDPVAAEGAGEVREGSEDALVPP